MDKEKIEQLILKCAETPNSANLNQLYSELEKNSADLKELTESLNLLFEGLPPENLAITVANFLISVAALNIEGTPKFRLLLTAAIKMLLPPYLDRAPVIKALGLRDNNVPPSNIIGRYKKLTSLKNGQILFVNSSGRFGTISNIDSIAGTLVVNQFGVSGTANVPLELVLISGLIFNSGIEMVKIADASGRTKMSSVEFRNIIKAKAVLPLTDDHYIQLAKAGIAAKMSPEDFLKWWSDKTVSAPVGTSQRRSCDGRTLQEIILLLNGEDKTPLSDDEADKFAAFFEKLRQDVISRDLKSLAEVIVKLSLRGTPEQQAKMLKPLQAKAPFWPSDPLRGTCEELTVWSELAAKDIVQLATITKNAFGELYIAALSMRLPLKSLNSITNLAMPEDLDDIICEQHCCSADLCLWIWKNRKKGSEDLLKHLTIDNIIRAVSQENMPKAWTPSLRELKVLLMDNAEFHKFLLEISGDPLKLTSALQAALFLSSGERQSLIVKLARSSKELQAHLEDGMGEKILRAGMSEKELKQQDDSANVEPAYTSMKSYRALLKELDDIIKIHKPENREALKTARAHGDFRENAEFDAAKERRNFLGRRQNELERDLLNIQAVDLRKVKIGKTAVVGCMVTLEIAGGKTETYALLGAWDGNPEKNYLSYKTRLGQLIYNREIGTELELPNHEKAVLTKVEPLPESVLAEMD